jgi:hypothetical protein
MKSRIVQKKTPSNSPKKIRTENIFETNKCPIEEITCKIEKKV